MRTRRLFFKFKPRMLFIGFFDRSLGQNVRIYYFVPFPACALIYCSHTCMPHKSEPVGLSSEG